MQQQQQLMGSPSQRQRGITLIESLVAIVVAALGILGILGVQMRTLTDTQTTMRRAQAIRLAEDLGERLKAHPNSLLSLGSYAHVGTNAPEPAPAVNCATTACNSSQLTTYDVAEWVRSVQRTLPLGDATIFLAPGETDATNRRQLGVMISWNENERFDADASYSAGINAVTGGGGGGTCTAKRTCHLQYIPVSARCAPYSTGIANPKQPYCAGA